MRKIEKIFAILFMLLWVTLVTVLLVYGFNVIPNDIVGITAKIAILIISAFLYILLFSIIRQIKHS